MRAIPPDPIIPSISESLRLRYFAPIAAPPPTRICCRTPSFIIASGAPLPVLNKYTNPQYFPGSTQNLFETFTADQGSTTANTTTDTLTIAGGTNLSTIIATDSDIVTINMDSFPINFLSDVDTSSNPPNPGEVLKWDGAKWAPGADATTGGAGTDADTLDGFDSQYYAVNQIEGRRIQEEHLVLIHDIIEEIEINIL